MSRVQCAYDHWLRNLVGDTGDARIATRLYAPRFAAAGEDVPLAPAAVLPSAAPGRGIALTKSVHSPRYAELRRLIIAARKNAGLTQVDVAARLGKPQSYVSKVESGERRIDVVELIEIAEAVGFDAAAAVRRVGRG